MTRLQILRVEQFQLSKRARATQLIALNPNILWKIKIHRDCMILYELASDVSFRSLCPHWHVYKENQLMSFSIYHVKFSRNMQGSLKNYSNIFLIVFIQQILKEIQNKNFVYFFVQGMQPRTQALTFARPQAAERPWLGLVT